MIIIYFLFDFCSTKEKQTKTTSKKNKSAKRCVYVNVQREIDLEQEQKKR